MSLKTQHLGERRFLERPSFLEAPAPASHPRLMTLAALAAMLAAALLGFAVL